MPFGLWTFIHLDRRKLLILLVNTLPLPTLVDTTILKPPVFCTILIRITAFTLFFATAVIITLGTSAGSLRSKSFRTRSSKKLGRKHNKEGGGEKGNAFPETPQFGKMYTQLLIGVVLVVLIKEWLMHQLNQVCFVHLCRWWKCLDCYLFESFLCQNLTNLSWREVLLASLLFHHNAYKPGRTLPKSDAILISVTYKRAYVIPIVLASSRFSIWWPRKTKRPWGRATTANWVAVRHWMRMRKNWHDPMCLLRPTCTYYFFYLKKKKHLSNCVI